MIEFGDDLNSFRNIKLIEAKTSGELELLLAHLGMRFNLMQVYHDGKNHVAVVVPERKLTNEKIRRIKNGIIEKKEVLGGPLGK